MILNINKRNFIIIFYILKSFISVLYNTGANF